MTLIKRYPARLHTAFWGPPMCTEERKTLKDTEEEEEQRSETKKAVVKTSTENNTDTTPLIQTTYSTGNRTEINIRDWCVNWSRPLDRQIKLKKRLLFLRFVI